MDRGVRSAPALLVHAVMVLTMSACSSAAVGPATPSSSTVASALPSSAPSAAAAITPSPIPSETAGPKVTPVVGAPDSGVILHLAAKNSRWNVTTLAAPAGKTWQVEIANQGLALETHNFTVASGPDFASRIFTSPRFTGGQTPRFDIPGLPAGTYLFLCTLHANTMTGTLILK
jgi:plastocyanin